MAELTFPFLLKLPEPDRLPFRNLALIRPQLPSERQLELIESLARNLVSGRLLALISRTPHWLVHAPVLHALADNEHTPETIRRDLEVAVSLFDLMREMDRAPEGEKEERAEVIKALHQQLQPELKPIVKQMAKQLARSVNATGSTLELPPLPEGEADWEALTALPPAREPMKPYLPPRREREMSAESTLVAEDLKGFLVDEDLEVRAAALRNPGLTDEIVLASLPGCSTTGLFEELYQEARWYFKESVREACCGAPCCPGAMAKRMDATRDLVQLLEQGGQSRRHLHRIVSLFTQMEESEYQFMTFWAKRKAPNMLRVIKIFFDRLQRRRANQASGLSPAQTDGRWVSLEERVFLANQASQPDQMVAALRDPDPQVFCAALENPALTLRELIHAIPSLDGPKALRLVSSRTWGSNAAVKEALLHNASLPEETALKLLRSLAGPPRVMLDLLRDQRIAHLSLKHLAMDLLHEAYEAMPVPQRILALRASGGELMRHLGGEIMRDEGTLSLLVADRQLDPTILLRLARNKQTPRPILALIAGHPALMAHPAVMSELLLNPKTPRDASTRIWGLLSESEQQHLLRSPHLPTSLRFLG